MEASSQRHNQDYLNVFGRRLPWKMCSSCSTPASLVTQPIYMLRHQPFNVSQFSEGLAVKGHRMPQGGPTPEWLCACLYAFRYRLNRWRVNQTARGDACARTNTRNPNIAPQPIGTHTHTHTTRHTGVHFVIIIIIIIPCTLCSAHTHARHNLGTTYICVHDVQHECVCAQ